MDEPILDNFSYHYPPELLEVLIETIPTLVKSKQALLSFFRNAGVSSSTLKPYEDIVSRDRNAIKMYDIARGVLIELNEQGDKSLSTRRKILKAVVDFEDFDTCCYENRRNEARGLVWKVREIVNRKDSFTRMRIERDNEKLKNIREKEAALVAEKKKKQERIKRVQADLSSLLKSENPHKRGKDLEKVLNELFACYGILVRDSFVIKGDCSEGIIEQIDGAIELDNAYYIVEMKWWKNTIGRPEVIDHIVRIANRGGQVRGLYISFSDYSDAAISECKNALNRNVLVVLATIDEIFRVLEADADLKSWLKAKEQAAVLDKKPYVKV
ncbi:TPA: restriction endonuclease [Methanosarcina acetivorans]|nr:restriction endonuclease [Methanosarcina acetivorans]HIH93476.1 restriction endonuclease [Methanosarcina acetivorans]